MNYMTHILYLINTYSLIFIFAVVVVVFLGLCYGHMEVPRLQVDLEMLAPLTTQTLSKAGIEPTSSLDTSWVHYC